MRYFISIDDWHEGNLKMAEILKKYHLQATFFIECNEPKKVKQIEDLKAQGFNIGSHTFSHPPDLKRLAYDDLLFELKKSKEITQSEIIAFPRGRWNMRCWQLAKALGYKYGRTTVVGDTLDIDEHLVRGIIPLTIHAYPRKEYQGQDWLDLALYYLEDKFTRCFKFMCHVKEIERFNYWEKIEILFSYLKKSKLTTRI